MGSLHERFAISLRMGATTHKSHFFRAEGDTYCCVPLWDADRQHDTSDQGVSAMVYCPTKLAGVFYAHNALYTIHVIHIVKPKCKKMAMRAIAFSWRKCTFVKKRLRPLIHNLLKSPRVTNPRASVPGPINFDRFIGLSRRMSGRMIRRGEAGN